MEFDFGEIGDWPIAAKAVLVVLLCAAVVIGGYWFFTQNKWLQFKVLKNGEPELKAAFEAKQVKAANLKLYKKELEKIKFSFESMLRQLSSKTEVANLLVDISQVGVSSGLEFELFKPGIEVPVDFYAELPIQIRVVGHYHQFGEFVSKVAALPRIVTLHDFSIQHKDKREGKLAMEITAKTYRYFDEGENTTAVVNWKRDK